MFASIRPAPSRGGYLFRDKVKWMLRRSSQLQEARKRHRVGHLRDCAKLRLHGWQMVNQNIEGFIKSIEDQGADYGFAKRETGRILDVMRSKIISPISTNQSARSSPLSQAGRVSLLKAANTSLNSKVVSQNSAQLSPIAVDAVLKVIDHKRENNVNLKDIKSIKELGGTVDATELVDGMVFEQKAANGPKSMEKAKIGFIQFCVSPPQDGHRQPGGGVGLRHNGQSSS